MQIAIHLGAHCTDEGRLLRCLLKNRGRLAKEGVAVPGPGRYRVLMRQTMQAFDGTPVTTEAEAALLKTILDDDAAARLVLSYDNFLCVPHKVLGEGMIYPMAGDRAAAYAGMFPGHEVEFHIGIRNPATFLPALYDGRDGVDFAAFLNGCDPMRLCWSEVLIALREAAPDVPVTVWCDEDTPLIWPEVLGAVSDHGPETELEGRLAILSEIMTAEGMTRLRGYLARKPPTTAAQRRRIVAAFLDKYARPEAVEIELDLPGWTDDYVTTLTEHYDEDVATIARLPGVRYLAP